LDPYLRRSSAGPLVLVTETTENRWADVPSGLDPLPITHRVLAPSTYGWSFATPQLLKPRYVLITELPQDGSEDLTLLIREHVEYLIV